MRRSVTELLHSYQARMEAFVSGAQDELRGELVPSLGPPRLKAQDVVALQAELPIQLPDDFVAYLLGPAVENGLEWAEIIIPSNIALDVFAVLLLQRELWAVQLLQFAWGPCGHPVCFDFSAAETARAGVIVVVDHDTCDPADWADAKRVRDHVSRRWESFNELLEFVCDGGA